MDRGAATRYRRAEADYDAFVNQLLQETFNGNLLYLAASVLVFGDDVCSDQARGKWGSKAGNCPLLIMIKGQDMYSPPFVPPIKIQEKNTFYLNK